MTQQELELPKGWARTTLSKIAIIKSGGTPSTSEKEYWNGDIPWINSGKVKDDLINECSKYITSKGLENSAAKLFPKNTVVIALTGATTAKVGYLTFQSTANQSITGIFPNEFFIPKLIFWELINERQRILMKKIGTAQHHINQKIVENIIIPFPPLNEQKRIVSKIEELVSKIDSAKQSLEHTKLQLEQYRMSLLKYAFEDLEKKYESWKLDDICIKITDGEHLRPNYTTDGIPFLTAKNVRDHGVTFDDIDFVSKNDAEVFHNRCNPQQNDILIVSRGATVGRLCVVDTEKKFCLLGSVILIKTKKTITSKFLAYFLKSPTQRRDLIKISGSTAQQAIYIRDIKKSLIPLPPLEEQKQIVSQIEQGFSLIENSQRIVNSTLQTLEIMRMSVLKQAFQGKLVPQDPNDEPASVLLERIKKEKLKIRQ